MVTNENPKYKVFGELFLTLRRTAGYAQQSDLATLLNTTQQTISRWEQGVSRPRSSQIPEIAKVLNNDLKELLEAAGYQPEESTAATFDQPFPLKALSPISFERFCTYFIANIYKEADVHPYGSQGHKQDGLDIEAIFPDNRIITFQCKRHSTFGEKKVEEVIKAHSKEASKKILLLSRTASPQARNKIAEHQTWELWDVEDVSRKIRQELSKKEQIDLVDIFFKGQRLALLGELEAGPWESAEKYFSPYLSKSKNVGFSHHWTIVGRKKELDKLIEFVDSDEQVVALLSGKGGSGKSRLLWEFSKIIAETKKISVYCLTAASLTRESLEQLGNKPKLLICDDAHDRQDLDNLFYYIASTNVQTKLVLSFRSYGLPLINHQATKVALIGKQVVNIELPLIHKADIKELALQVLRAFGGDENSADAIAQYTADCPLATVIGAELVAKEKIYPSFLYSEDGFRKTLFDKFTQIIAGDIGKLSERPIIEKLLKYIALIQPIHIEDEATVDAFQKLEDIEVFEARQLLKLLVEAGILFRRGNGYRITPDLLADFIIEKYCITAEGHSSGYAEHIFDYIPKYYIENLLVNLGRLDWRRLNGDTSQSNLLKGIWKKLKFNNEYHDEHLEAASKVAYYQPEQALKFAEYIINEGLYHEKLLTLLKYASYNMNYLSDVCALLWKIAQMEKRGQNNNISGIDVLKDLIAPEPNKPIQFCEEVAEFALSRISKPKAWTQSYTPLSVLESSLKTEGYTTSSTRNAINMTPFFVTPAQNKPLRQKVIDACLTLLTHEDIRRGVQAAQVFEEALRFPMGILGVPIDLSYREQWAQEFLETLSKIYHIISNNKLHPIVLIQLGYSVSWHANYYDGVTNKVAKDILACVTGDLTFKTILMLSSGWGRLNRIYEVKDYMDDCERKVGDLCSEINKEYTDKELSRQFIEECLIEIQKVWPKTVNESAYKLINKFCSHSKEFAIAILENAIHKPNSPTSVFSGNALKALFVNDLELARNYVVCLMRSPTRDFLVAVAEGYCSLKITSKYTENDMLAINSVLQANDEWVIRLGANIIRVVAQTDPSLAVHLVINARIDFNEHVADDYLLMLINLYTFFTEYDIEKVLDKLIKLQTLNSYWIQEFLSKISLCYPHLVISLFKNRINYSIKMIQQHKHHYQPVPFGPYQTKPFQLKDRDDYLIIINEIFDWGLSKVNELEKDDAYLFFYRFSDLIAAISTPYDGRFTLFLEDWLLNNGINGIYLFCKVLGKAQPKFVFEQAQFICRLLEYIEEYGSEIEKKVKASLFSSAIGGVKSTIPGQPFPEDLAIKEASEKLLANLPRFHPAYSFYNILREHAEIDIKRSTQEEDDE